MVLPTLETAKATYSPSITLTKIPYEYRGTSFFVPERKGVSVVTRPDLAVPRTRPRVTPTPSYDFNANGDDGIPSKFTSPEFYSYRREGGYVGEPSVPSREVFSGEGGLFGEPTIVGEAEEGLAFGEQKEGFDWELIFLIGGIILLFIIVAVF